jgi:hypothetical protein
VHVLLVEPDYYTRYPPLGLLKLATYHKQKGHSVELVRGNTIPARHPDLIYVTSLFTWAWIPVHSSVRYYKLHYPDVPLHLGGVYATLLPSHAELSGADYVHKGIMGQVEEYLPSYDLVPEWDGSILFASRGCIRKCGFCAVPKLEGAPKYLKSAIEHLIFPKHTRIIFNDNNILGNNNWKDIFDEVIKIGKKVDFNQGLDARLITDEAAEELGQMKFFPALRIAYDYVGIGKFVKKAIERLISNGICGRDIFVYILFNYADSPDDFFQRVREVINWGATAYPMRYIPLNSLDKNKHVGPKWDVYSLQRIQRARRVIGYGGAFPPYEGLVKKLNKAKNFYDAFELVPLKKTRKSKGVIEHSKEMIGEGSGEHLKSKSRSKRMSYWSTSRVEENWRLIPKKTH